MNEIKKLKLNIDSLFELVNSDKPFFFSVSSYVNKLKQIINSSSIDIEELEFLAEKIEEFYKNYRSSDRSGLYIPPRQTSNSDSIVREINQLIKTIKLNNPNGIVTQSEEDETNSNEPELVLIDQRLYASCKVAYESKDYWNFVLNATRHLEIRIREKANLDANYHGVDLINKSFNPRTGKLKNPSCETMAEEEGFFQILRGLILFHRNPKGHREGTIEKTRAFQIVNYVDYLIALVETSVGMNR